jgi:hypothetical protein
MASRLDPEIVEILHKRTGKAKSTIRSQISRKRQKSPILTSNAAAHLIAQENKTSVLQKLDDEDRKSLQGMHGIAAAPMQKTVQAKLSARNGSRRLKSIVTYDSEDYFVKEHIGELTRAYNAKCYTCVFILFRKILENRIIDILKAKFPKQYRLTFDQTRSRNHDFSVVLENLYRHRTSFTHDGKKAIERLHQLVKSFKKDANDKAHSWFHIVRSESEIDKSLLEQALQLVKFLEKETQI